MHQSVFISEVIKYGPNLPDTKIIEIAENMASYYNLKSQTKIDSVPEIAFEKDFKNSSINRIIKMSKTEHIDSFFEDGSIQLGSFKYYQQFDNPEIGDKSEGSFIIVGCNSKSTTFAVVGGGFNNYLFCTYNGDPDPEIIQKFGYNDYFEIINISGFQHAVEQTLKSVFSLGSICQYRQMKVLVGNADENFNLYNLSGGLINLVNYSKYFLKISDFHHQQEYRLLWTVPYDLNDKVIIKCPEAIQYCRRK